jgi:aldehyde dehydrogenase (NAD+)
VAFTGSTEVGRDVARRAVDHLAFPAMELGGNGPHVVLDDADVDRAVAAGTFGSFLHQGQVCISINRHLVHESIYGEYVDALVDRAESLAVGDPSDGDVIVGPVIDDSQRDQMLAYVAETVEAGATLETGGRVLGPGDIDGPSAAAVDLQDAGVSAADVGADDADADVDADLGDPTGRFVLPTVLSDVGNDMAAACNEHFGPIAPVIPYADVDEAVELANDTEYGLAASVFGGDVARAESVADRVEAGMVHVNDQPINDEPHVMFGGTKASGIGRFNGEQVLEELTETKWVSIQREPRQYPF